jgi:hypothetical protein
LVFKDPAERKYKAEDLWLTGQNIDHSRHPLMIAPVFPCFFFIFSLFSEAVDTICMDITRYSITINVIVDLTTSIVLMSRVIVSFKLSRVSDFIFTTMS